MLSQATAHSLSLVSPGGQAKQVSEKKAPEDEQQGEELEKFSKEKESFEKEREILERQKVDYEKERELLEKQREEIQRLREEERKRLEFERILLEAREASIKNRYEEFGILEMGLAKKVTNLWLGKSVVGEQRIFPLSQGRVDWYCQYRQWSRNSWKALAMVHRKYRAYWYPPDKRLFLQKDFKQSTVRAEFAKTTLEWDPALGDRLVGEWTLRVFESGKLVDERTFELVK